MFRFKNSIQESVSICLKDQLPLRTVAFKIKERVEISKDFLSTEEYYFIFSCVTSFMKFLDLFSPLIPDYTSRENSSIEMRLKETRGA